MFSILSTLSIRDKLILYSSLIILSVAIPVTLGSYLNDREESLNNSQREAMRVGQMLYSPLIQLLSQNKISELSQDINNLRVNADIQDAMILSPDGKILAELNPVNSKMNLPYFLPYMQQIMQSNAMTTVLGNRMLVVGGPLKSHEDVLLGFLYIQFSLDKAHERIRMTLFINLLTLGLSLMLGLILARVLSNHFSKPIMELIHVANNISSGSKEVVFPKQSYKEFSVLSQALKIMLRNLHQTQERLEEATVILDKKVKERTKELEEAIHVAEDANQSKSRFLANVSHEIRTPMNGMVGTASLLKNTTLDKEQRKYVDIIQLSAESLLNLINEILDLSKIESGKLDIEQIPMDVRQISQEVMDIMEYRIKEKGLSFGCIVDPQLPHQLLGDPSRLRQILLNLTTNAIKFTHKGHIKIVIKLLEEKAQRLKLKFSVADSGIGIPPSKLDKLFKAFSQVDASTTRQYGGTGLGLAISKKLSELMGGEVGVESEAGVGSEFWFTVFLAKDPQSPPEVISPILKDKNIFIYDEDIINLEFMNNILPFWGCKPQTIRKEELALGALIQAQEKHFTFDAIILNELHAAAVLPEVKNYCRDIACPIIFISNEQNREPLKTKFELTQCQIMSFPLKETQVYHALLRALGEELADSGDVITPTQELIPSKEAKDIKVLVVDDNVISQQVTIKMLETLGYQVHGANNGIEALEAINVIAFDLILMDCQMPEMDGYEATKKIRENPIKKHLPIIALTANAMKGDKDACLAAGMNDYLSKPIKAPSLAAMMKKYTPTIQANKNV